MAPTTKTEAFNKLMRTRMQRNQTALLEFCFTLALQLMDGSNPLYGYIGIDDYTLDPVIRPGAFVRVDPRQKKILSVNWQSDDRPIFFIELRERYVCTWCEMHDGRLILIPTQQSKRRAQHVRYPADATIIGRVTGVTIDLVEPSEGEGRA